MLQYIIHRILRRRHFWRYATFSEISELYASRMMRILALRIVTVFTSIFLLQIGYSLFFVAIFWAAFYLMRVLFSWPAALMVAHVGPKHATLVSNIISALSMALLPLVSQSRYGVLVLVGWSAVHAYAGVLNDIAYMVDFSKVKSPDHAGKELGFMNIIEKVATGLGPFVGGIVAYMFGPESIMLLSAVLFLLSALPLFASAEPTRTHIPIRFRSFPWRTTWRSLVAVSGVGADMFTTATVWAIFMALVLFGITSNKVYAEIGFVTSVTLLVSIAISHSFGRIIDRSKGGELLKISTILNSGIHGIRMFVTTPFGAIFTNILNEISTAGYNMPFLRGVFDTADYSGRRIEYLFLIEAALNLGGFVSAVIFAILVVSVGDVNSLKSFFVIGGLLSLLIMTPRFALYKK
jgi:MFS family permease